MSGKGNIFFLVLKADFNCKLMSGKGNYFFFVLKADFNCNLMSGKIKFILPNIYFTHLYSTAPSLVAQL